MQAYIESHFLNGRIDLGSGSAGKLPFSLMAHEMLAVAFWTKVFWNRALNQDTANRHVADV